MEKNQKINKFNDAGVYHGYWEDRLFKRHYYNKIKFGYEICFTKDQLWQCHYINNFAIGCEQVNNNQYFFNKPGNRFGEWTKWKWQ